MTARLVQGVLLWIVLAYVLALAFMALGELVAVAL